MVPTVKNAIIPLNDLDLLRLVERVMKVNSRAVAKPLTSCSFLFLHCISGS